MPYPNEHSARLKDPKGFNPKTFRRTNNGTLYGKIKVPKTIAIIWGKLKGKDKPSDPPIAQALRFPIKSWTAEKARDWLRKNNVKYIRFEPAEKKSKQTKEELSYRCECIKCGHQMTSTKHCKDLKCPKCGGQMRRVERPGPGQNSESINSSLGTIKKDPFIFNQPGTVEFAESDDDHNNVRLVLYDGSVVKHWFWGNIAFELATMKMAKKRNPILFAHDTNQRLAFSERASFEKKFVVEGTFLKTSQKAQETKQEMLEGFPFESSLRFDPDRSKIEHIKEGESVEVNGHTLKGPGTLVRNTVVVEGSICVFGALKNTTSEAFGILENEKLNQKEITMDDETKLELTAETFAAEYPELSGEITMAARAEGEKEARELFSQFTEKFGDDPAFCIEQFKKGATLAEAVEAENAKLKDAATKAAEEVADKDKKPDPAAQEFSDEQGASKEGEGKDGKPATWDAAMKQRMTETKCSEADAVRFCVREYPELHAKMLEEQKK